MEEYKKYVLQKDIKIYRQTGHTHEPHLHDFIEFVYIVSGKAVHTVGETEYAVAKGDMIIINYNQTHSFRCNSDTEQLNILLKPEFVDRQIKNCDDVFDILNVSGYEGLKTMVDRGRSVVRFSHEERIRFESVIFLLEKESQNKEPGYLVSMHSCINLMLSMIFRKMSQTSLSSGKIANNEMLRYIKEHCGEKLTVEMLSANGHYDPAYFSRSFKKYTGVSFTEYLKRERMQLACELLLNTADKVDDIYIKSGYSDKTKFFKHFREYTNTTPLKFRKNQKQILF